MSDSVTPPQQLYAVYDHYTGDIMPPVFKSERAAQDYARSISSPAYTIMLVNPIYSEDAETLGLIPATDQEDVPL